MLKKQNAKKKAALLSCFLLAPHLFPSKKSGSERERSVRVLPLPAALQSDWLGEVREARRRLLLTLWWQTGRTRLKVCE